VDAQPRVAASSQKPGDPFYCFQCFHAKIPTLQEAERWGTLLVSLTRASVGDSALTMTESAT
jgi:hypothetical protein